MSASERSTIRLQLIGARNAIAGLTGTAASVREVGAAQKMQGRSALIASERTWLHNQSLFTLRRYAYAGTLALTALIGETLKWGYQFNQTMASSRTALAPVFHDTRALNSELVGLYNFTKRTPFQFKDITIAFRQMYAAFHPLGISVSDTNLTIKSLVDALSYAGRTTPGALNRVAVALQHMAYQGHLTGMNVLQLARDGIPIFQVLEKELGLTADQLHHVGTLGIPTARVLQAINHYIEHTPGFMNAAARQAKTFGGSLTTLRDNISQLMGGLTFGSYSRGPGFIQNLNKTFDQIGKIVQRNAAAGRGQSISWAQATHVFEKAYPVLTRFIQALNLVIFYARGVGNILRNSLIPAASDVLKVYGAFLIPLLYVLGYALNFLGHHGFLLRIILTYLIARFVALRVAMFAAWVIARLQNATWAVQKGRLMAVTIWTNFLTLAQLRQGVAVGNLTAMQAMQLAMIGRVGRAYRWMRDMISLATTGIVASRVTETFALSAMQVRVLALRRAVIAYWIANNGLIGSIRALTVAMIEFLFTNPVGWAILLIAALTVLYFKTTFFRENLNKLWRDMIYFSPLMAAALYAAFGPLGVAVLALAAIIRYWRQIKQIASGNVGDALGIPRGHWYSQGGIGHAIGLPNSITGYKPAHAAMGGTVMSSGMSWVGENGPELASLPRGAVINPAGGGFHFPDINLTSIIQMDGRKVAEVNAKHRLDVEARA